MAIGGLAAALMLLAGCGGGGGGSTSGGPATPPPPPASTEYWAKSLGGAQDDALFLQIPTSDGKVLLGGTTKSFGAGGTDVWLVKVDLSGGVVAQVAFGGAGEDKVFDLKPLATGGFIFVGSTTSFGATAPQGWVVKLSPDLTIEWEKRYPLEAGYQSSVFTAVVPAGDHFAVLGYLSGATLDQAVLLNVAADGSLVDQNLLVGQGRDGVGFTRVASACLAPDNGIVLVGDADAMFANYHRGAWFARVAPDLKTVSWSKWMGGDTSSSSASVLKAASDGGFILAGQSPASIGFTDPWVIKFGGDGVVAWQMGVGGSGWNIALDVVETSGGGFQVVSSTTSFGSGDQNLWLFQLNASGAVQWQKTFGVLGSEAAVGAALWYDPVSQATFMAADSKPQGTTYSQAWFVKVKQGGICPPYETSVSGFAYLTSKLALPYTLAPSALGSTLTATTATRTLTNG